MGKSETSIRPGKYARLRTTGPPGLRAAPPEANWMPAFAGMTPTVLLQSRRSRRFYPKYRMYIAELRQLTTLQRKDTVTVNEKAAHDVPLRQTPIPFDAFPPCLTREATTHGRLEDNIP